MTMNTWINDSILQPLPKVADTQQEILRFTLESPKFSKEIL